MRLLAGAFACNLGQTGQMSTSYNSSLDLKTTRPSYVLRFASRALLACYESQRDMSRSVTCI